MNKLEDTTQRTINGSLFPPTNSWSHLLGRRPRPHTSSMMTYQRSDILFELSMTSPSLGTFKLFYANTIKRPYIARVYTVVTVCTQILNFFIILLWTYTIHLGNLQVKCVLWFVSKKQDKTRAILETRKLAYWIIYHWIPW